MDGFFETTPSFETFRFIKGQIWFIGYCKWSCCINDFLVEGKNGIGRIQQKSRYFTDISVKSHTEEGPFFLNVFEKLLIIHRLYLFKFCNDFFL